MNALYILLVYAVGVISGIVVMCLIYINPREDDNTETIHQNVSHETENKQQ